MTQASETRSTCAYCGVGCGVLLRPDGQGGLSVRGDPDHPANLGRLCSKGAALGETLGLDGRLLAPRVAGRDAGWDTALQLVADRFRATIAEHGPESVAFYVSGQMLTEDYYVANKLMKGFIGSANIDTNSRLCMSSSVAGHKRAFGTDTVPGTYEDLEAADLVVLVGSNLAWCHPVLYQRLAAAKAARPGLRVVTVDPRRTATSDLADLHLGIAPGGDVALFNVLLARLDADGATDRPWVDRHVAGYDAALAEALRGDAGEIGVPAGDLEAFLAMWSGTEKVVTVYSQGVNQSAAGSDKVNAILNCHLATGRIGRPGMGPLSVTGQPNAMGGREVGGMANMLASHLDLENPAHRATVRGFWNSGPIPEAPGLKAVEMFRALGDGRIKAIWIIGTNPAVSMPEADAVRAAIAGGAFVVVSDIVETTDTTRLAQVLLPATGWGEKDGTVTNSDRMISRQRGVLPAPGQARPDWAILAEVGRRMGFGAAFDYVSPAEIFREHAALSGLAARLGRDFDISGLTRIDDAAYDAMPPRRWPIAPGQDGGRFFAHGGFYTADRKARMLPLRHRAPVARITPDMPFRLNTGRVRDQWHTMTRTGRAARLSGHIAEPFLEIHPADADALGIAPATLVEVHNTHGRAVLRALLTDRVRRGEVFAPIHWTGETAPSGRIGALLPGAVDPVSGQPELKAAAVALRPFAARWYGFAVSSGALAPAAEYWARARSGTGLRAELAGRAEPADWLAEARALFGLSADIEAVSMAAPAKGLTRLAFVDRGRLVAALFIAPEPVALSRSFLAALPGSAVGAEVLAGRAGGSRIDPGPIVCACFDVGVNTILAAIESEALMTVDSIGEALQAGSNCGSCRPELKRLIAGARLREAAE